MPRNNQGLYTPPLPPVLPGELIESQWANATIDDLASALTASLPRDGSAPMTGPLILRNAPPSQPREAISKQYLEQFLAYATGMPVGAVFAFASAVTPAGYLLCNGQAVSRTTYAALFTVIGTTFGAGDGAITFNVPDMRDWFVRGKGDSRTLGSTQTGAIQSHTHVVQDPGHTHGASQAAHDHATFAHSHGVNDPGHFHQAPFYRHDDNGPLLGNANGGLAGTLTTDTRATGISIAAAAPNTDVRQPGVSVAGNTTGLQIGAAGDGETRPQNIALDYYIKAIDDASQVVALTGISSSNVNMISVSNTIPNVPELVIHSNMPFGIPQLDSNGKVLLAQLPTGALILLGYFDASSGGNPSQVFPTTNFSNGEMYVVSVGGTIPVRDPATGVESQTAVVVGGTLLYLEGQSQPDGWYYSVPVAADSAANISFLPEGTISATNVQAAIAELDSETQVSLAGKAPASAGTAVGTSLVPVGFITSTDVQDAFGEVTAAIGAISTPPASGVTFMPTGTIVATDVQSAIVEAASESVQRAGSTMTGPLLNPQYQVGASPDPAKNFTIFTPDTPDGTMKLARGNAGATTQDIMTVDADGKVAFPQNLSPTFRAYANATVAVSNDTPTQAMYQVEEYDIGSCYDPIGSRFQPQTAGYYLVIAVASFGAVTPNASSFAKITLRKNSVDEALGGSIYLGSVANTAQVSSVIYMNGSSDYITVEVYQLSGVSLGLGTSRVSNYFQATLARAA